MIIEAKRHAIPTFFLLPAPVFLSRLGSPPAVQANDVQQSQQSSLLLHSLNFFLQLDCCTEVQGAGQASSPPATTAAAAAVEASSSLALQQSQLTQTLMDLPLKVIKIQ